MAISLITLLVLIILLVIIFVLKLSGKIIAGTILSLVLISNIILLIQKPQVHKPFSINVINYLIKFNDDGSMTTTKTTTFNKIQIKDEK